MLRCGIMGSGAPRSRCGAVSEWEPGKGEILLCFTIFRRRRTSNHMYISYLSIVIYEKTISNFSSKSFKYQTKVARFSRHVSTTDYAVYSVVF